jgi:ketosteroid isomerase-like protein
MLLPVDLRLKPHTPNCVFAPVHRRPNVSGAGNRRIARVSHREPAIADRTGKKRRTAMTTSTRTVSADALKHAIEGRDAQSLIALYADDALLRIIDHDHPPSKPLEIKGKQAIAAYYEDVCGRAMTHRVDDALTADAALSFTQTCTYPDGAKVYCSAVLKTDGGKIVRQTSIQAWDS